MHCFPLITIHFTRILAMETLMSSVIRKSGFKRGEVAINNRIDVKSYISLHTFVNDMFPPRSLVEQGKDTNESRRWGLNQNSSRGNKTCTDLHLNRDVFVIRIIR